VRTDARQFLRSLREKLPGVEAFVLLGPGGEMLAHAAEDPLFNPELFAAEYATLLRIAQRT
jgi:predicted regulator of Ras-like GTPase activity (Roadblock/LC7/MglB family)